MRCGPGEARTILFLHIISVSPSKQPLMVRTFLKVYMELCSYFLFLQEQIKDIIVIRAAQNKRGGARAERKDLERMRTKRMVLLGANVGG